MDEVSHTFGEAVKMHRERKGLSQEELGEIFGVSYGAVSNWEIKSNYPTVKMLIRIADYFGISLDELIGRMPPRYSDKAYKLLAEFEKLDEAAQDYLLSMAASFPHRPGR